MLDNFVYRTTLNELKPSLTFYNVSASFGASCTMEQAFPHQFRKALLDQRGRDPRKSWGDVVLRELRLLLKRYVPDAVRLAQPFDRWRREHHVQGAGDVAQAVQETLGEGHRLTRIYPAEHRRPVD